MFIYINIVHLIFRQIHENLSYHLANIGKVDHLIDNPITPPKPSKYLITQLFPSEFIGVSYSIYESTAFCAFIHEETYSQKIEL